MQAVFVGAEPAHSHLSTLATVYLSGEGNSLRRKNEPEAVVTELVLNLTVCNDIHVVHAAEPVPIVRK